MMMESGVVLNLEGDPIYWHCPLGRTGGSLPESPELWDFLWANRTSVSGVAHSHPGFGVPGPSYTDVTTFAAIEAGLGLRLDWWITSGDSFSLFRWKGPDRLHYEVRQLLLPTWQMTGTPPWVAELRRRSNYQM